MFNINFRFKKGDEVSFQLSTKSPKMKGEVSSDKLDNGTLWVKYKEEEFNIHKGLIRPIKLQ